jgi:alcohol dehydrogenase
VKAEYPEVTTIVVGRSAFRRDFAARLGADVVIDAGACDPVAEIRDLTGGIGADVVIETTGNPEAVGPALAACRARGKVSIKSTHGVPTPVNLTDMVVREISMYTSRCGPFDSAIDLLRKKKVEVQSLMTEVFPLSRVQEAFAYISEKEDYIKVGLDTTQ